MYYLGRDLKTSHAGLGVNDEEWAANMRHTAEALDKHRIPEKEKGEVLAPVEKTKRNVVEKQGPASLGSALGGWLCA